MLHYTPEKEDGQADCTGKRLKRSETSVVGNSVLLGRISVPRVVFIMPGPEKARSKPAEPVLVELPRVQEITIEEQSFH